MKDTTLLRKLVSALADSGNPVRYVDSEEASTYADIAGNVFAVDEAVIVTLKGQSVLWVNGVDDVADMITDYSGSLASVIEPLYELFD